MASLTQTAYYSRKIIKYGSIAVVTLLILRSLVLSFSSYWKKTHPAPPPKPTFAFGKLPKLDFPERKNLPPIELQLETITGSLPKLPEQAKVYFVPSPVRGILNWDNTKDWAKTIGFNQSPMEMGTYDYRFISDIFPKTTLDVNVINRNFRLIYDWKDDINLTSQTTPPLEDQAISITKSFLQQAQALSPDLTTGSSEIIYLKYTDGNLAKALFSAEANFIKVNLFRENIDGLRVLPSNPKDSNVTALLSSSHKSFQGIVDLKYIHSTVSDKNFATYSIKDVQTAWSQLSEGKGFIANLGSNPGGKITVRNAFLAYFESETEQSFLQPIIVFEGDNDFYAYVPAIIDSWVEQ